MLNAETISWKRDPDANNVDAFTINWHKYYFYAFPPFPLILKCLQKIILDNATGIFVFPYWPSQPWYPLLKKLQKSELLFLDNAIVFDDRCGIQVRQQKFTLAAAILSGSHSPIAVPQNKR